VEAESSTPQRMPTELISSGDPRADK